MLRTISAFSAILLALATASSLAAASPAAPPRWIQATPFGGRVVALAQAPSAPQILYAAAQNGRVFRSVDGGATWRRRGPGTGTDQIADLVVDPQDAQTAYARTVYSALHRSRDGGRTWSQIGPEPQVFAFAADQDHPGVLFAATLNGLHRSDDGGDSWSLAGLEGSLVDGVAIDPRATGTIFARVNGAPTEEPTTIWKSTDHGATWTLFHRLEALSYNPTNPRFVFDPVRPEVLYLLFAESPFLGALRSAGGGASWSEIPSDIYVYDLTVSPEGILFAATESGLARSDDGGATWSPTLSPPPAPGSPSGALRDALTRILVSAARPGELLAAGSEGIWKSGNDGASWATSNQGLLAQGALAVAVSPTGPPAVFAVAGDSLFRSTDQGGTWTRLHSRFDGPQPSVIETFDSHPPRTIYGIGIDRNGQAEFPVTSTNGGRRWTKLPIPYSCDSQGSICDVSLAMVALDHDPESILVGGSYYFFSQGGGSFLWRIGDGGRTWEDLTPLLFLSDLVIDPRRRGTYHALTCEGIFRSTDAGTTWRKAGRGLPDTLCTPYLGGPTLVIDPQDPRRFYVATLNQGIFASSNGGATFRAMNRGLETAPITTILIDPTDSMKLYAGVAQQGVFQWNAEKRRWTPLNQGLPLAGFTGTIALDPRHPSLLYAVSSVDGVFRLDLEGSE